MLTASEKSLSRASPADRKWLNSEREDRWRQTSPNQVSDLRGVKFCSKFSVCFRYEHFSFTKSPRRMEKGHSDMAATSVFHVTSEKREFRKTQEKIFVAGKMGKFGTLNFKSQLHSCYGSYMSIFPQTQGTTCWQYKVWFVSQQFRNGR